MNNFVTPVKGARRHNTDILEQLGTPIRIPSSPFMKVLGYGSGVTVYRLDHSDGNERSPWAIKKLSKKCKEGLPSLQSNLYRSRMIQEAAILRALKHRNIVGFRSIVKDISTGDNSIALECCTISLGDMLERRLNKGNNEPLPVSKMKIVLRDIGRALDYLHTEALLLHGDIKSHNILVKGDFEICKLCDFGVSLPLERETGEVNMKANPHLKYVGTTIWTAPEVLMGTDIISNRADIFSYGLVVYEMIALVPPFTLDIGEVSVDDVQEHNNDEVIVEEREGSDEIRLVETENRIDGGTSDINLEGKLQTSIEVNSKGNLSQGDKSLEWNGIDSNISIHDTSEEIVDGEEDYDNFEDCGTRPSLPASFELNPENHVVIEVFYHCTNAEPNDRPSAKQILEILELSEA